VTLEQALEQQQERVDALIKSAKKYTSALTAWKKACQTGHVVNLQKNAALAEELAAALAEPTSDASESWDFDVRAYLESAQWRKELRSVAAARHELRTIEDEDLLISSPVVVRAQPGRNSLQIGKVNWPNIHPQLVAAELKRLRDRTAAAKSQDFLEALYRTCLRSTRPEVLFVKFREVYDRWCDTPGFKKENPLPAFAQQIYALQRSGIRTTKAGNRFVIEGPAGHPKERDILSVIAEDGQTIRYYGITFRK
jgi:hypothetical protein